MATTIFSDASPRGRGRDPHPDPRAHRAVTGGGAPGATGPRGVCRAQVSPRDLVVTAADPEFARHFGLSVEEICGQGFLDLLELSVPARLREQFAMLFTGRRRRFTERVTGRDSTGRTFSAEVTGSAVRTTSGDVTGVLVLLHHAGELRQRKKEAVSPPSAEPVLDALDAQVLEGVASGESTVQLASRLYLSRQGIEYRVAQMLRRFDAPNRPALVARAHALGLFAVGQWPPRVLQERVK